MPVLKEVLALGAVIGGARFALLDRGYETRWLEDVVLSAASGVLASWVVLSVVRPPLPPTALVAVRPLHRAFAAAAIRILVAAVIVSVLATSRFRLHLVSPFELVHYFFIVAPAVATGAFVEELLLGRRDWQAAAAGLFASGAAFYLFMTQAQWVIAGTPPSIIGVDAERTAAKVLLIALPIAIVAGARLRGAGILAVSVSVAFLTPILALAAWALGEAVDPRYRLLSNVEITAELVVALPIAVRLGDLVGPGPPPVD